MSFVISNQGLEANEELLQKITLLKGDITKQPVDAIFAPEPYKQKRRSMLSEAVRNEAGEEYCAVIDDLMTDQKPGFCVIVPSGNLPCKSILACLTPKWEGGFMGEDRAFVNCFENGILAAKDEGYRNLAIPVFLTGNHGYPKPRAVRLAVKAILKTANAEDFDELRFVAFKEDIYDLFKDRLERYGLKF